MTTPIQFVTKIRDLSVKEDNRYFIVKDQGCLKGLISYLHSSDSQVILISLEALNNISQSVNLKETVATQKGLQQTLRLLIENQNEQIKRSAHSTYTSLQPHFPKRSQQQHQSVSSASSNITPLRDATNIDNVGSSGGKNNQPRSVTLYISGLTNDVNRKELESALLQVKGVISFLIDLYSQKAVIRCRCSTDVLIKAVSGIGMEASLTKKVIQCSDENDVEPDYLDDEDEVETVDRSKALSFVDTPKENNRGNNAANNNGGWGWGRIAKALWG